MKKIKLHDLERISNYIENDLKKAFNNVLDEAQYLGGSHVKKFEEEWCKYTGAKDCCALTSGTDALHTAAMITGVKKGDEVIMPTHTFVATAEAFMHTGATLKYVDSKVSDYNIDEDKIEEQITNKTKVIVWTDVNGQTPDIEKILKIAKKYKLVTVEDAAPSSGAIYKKKMTGSLADITCFSFGPVKNLGSIGGSGAITGTLKICNHARKIRSHGKGKGRDNFKSLGWNRQPHSMQMAFLLAKLPYLKELNNKKRYLALRYNKYLKNVVNNIPKEQFGRYHPYHLYSILVDKRNELKKYLEEKKIECLIHWGIGVHEFTFTTTSKKKFPITKLITQQSLTLPCHPFLKKSEQNYIIDNIKKFYK